MASFGGTFAGPVEPVEPAVAELAVAELAVAELAVAELAEPRETVRRAFAAALTTAAAEFGGGAANGPAAEIESACYNAAVRTCKESADPPRRHWDSPQFVDVYSTRCGSVHGLLDPRSATNRSYAPRVVARLLSGELTYAALGSLPERDLCPAALAAERAVIAARSAQRVVAKESAIFQCPHCKERRCTYTEVQRRSLDEPPDYVCVCLNERCRRQFNGRT